MRKTSPTPLAPQDEAFEKAWRAAQALANAFGKNSSFYLSGDYQEAEVRKYFLDKFFKQALDWDVDHEGQVDPYRREVRIEKPERKAKGRADYAFSIAPQYSRVRFFVEAKRPQQDIATPDNCFQAIRYSWPKGLPIAVLTDFHSLHIVDCRFRPNINSARSRVVRTWGYRDLLDRERFAEIYFLLSRNAVARGSIDLFAEEHLPTVRVATRQYTLFAEEAREFDDVFLDQLDDWRETLAGVFKRARTDLDSAQLTECVQRTLDRLVFIRFLEDKLIEPEPLIAHFGTQRKTHWQDFIAASRRLDQTYNGIVFKPHAVLDDPRFQPDAAAFAQICDDFTDAHSPYNFDSIPVEILGRIYERFLGKVVLATNKQAKVVEKDDVRRAGGVYYTPDYIVAYMVEQALGPQVQGKTADEILALRVVDTAAGSGSFLIGAFAYLLRELTAWWHRQKRRPKDVVAVRDGQLHLTLAYKRRVLLDCIYGVDIDAQAVEVAQLSLYLKLMEDETTYSVQEQQMQIHAALLPPLTRNVVVGNALVTLEDDGSDLFGPASLSAAKSLDFKAAFPQVFRAGGFDLVIGNPPYIKEFTNQAAFDHVRESPYYQGKMDLWYLFACRGLDWLKPESGTLAFIATNNWTTNKGAEKLRAKITTDARIEQVIDFGDFKVFRDAGIQTMILIARRSAKPARYSFDYRKLEGKGHPLAAAQALLAKEQASGCVFLEPTFDRARTPKAPLTFAAASIENTLKRVAAKRNFSLTEKEVGVGIDIHQDFASAKAAAASGGKFAAGEGIFNLSHDELLALKITASERELIKPFYTTAELSRYAGNRRNRLWVVYTDSRFKERAAMAPYPNLKRHFDRFAKAITSDNRPYGLHRARDERFFVGEKIMAVRKCAEPCFTYTDFPCYVSQTFNVVKTDRVDLHYLTALLNSRVVRFWLRHRGKMQGGNFQVDKEPLLAIPLHVPSVQVQQDIARRVRHIIEAMRHLAQAQTDAERVQRQRLVDQMDEQIQTRVADLYELTGDDRATLDAAA